VEPIVAETGQIAIELTRCGVAARTHLHVELRAMCLPGTEESSIGWPTSLSCAPMPLSPKAGVDGADQPLRVIAGLER
jgi:hypothetical protein